ncbi:hypothetical protein [Burkholderia anthina]|uniref:hypothetical protein n=1 Tax=Burkholderia anthina TaxID=179879 RepID=UPI0015899F3F|nr:hypothetical protein [Burkholderia anthina]
MLVAFLSASRMLVLAHNGRVQQHTFDLYLIGHDVRHAFPSTLATPSEETHVHHMSSAELFRPIAPRVAGAAGSGDSFDDPTIVDRRAPWITFSCPAEQIRFVSILHRSITFEASWPTRAKNKSEHISSNVKKT